MHIIYRNDSSGCLGNRTQTGENAGMQMDQQSLPKMLTPEQTKGFLQRFMPGRDAAVWLENDRRHQPVLPFVQHGTELRYFEEDVIQFVRKLSSHAPVRNNASRRDAKERRYYHTERRDQQDRRYSRRAARNDIDRRFAVRPDRRGDLDRRIRGWVDRRCVEDRRNLA